MKEPHRRWSRRLFMGHMAALAAGTALGQGSRPEPTGPGIRIAGLTLQTSQPIATMKRFYADTIGFPLVSESGTHVTLRAGTSTVTFRHAPDLDAFYHFAFNIPRNQIRSAHAFQQERSPLIVPPERLNDPGLPREVVAFRHWNAHSVFFWDPAGNAVEYIARHDIPNDRDGGFSTDSVIAVSEIGLVTDDVPALATTVKQGLGVATYVSASDQFEPIGSVHGLLLIMKRGVPMAFDQGGARDVFPTEVRLERPAHRRLAIDAHPYALLGS